MLKQYLLSAEDAEIAEKSLNHRGHRGAQWRLTTKDTKGHEGGT
jgi:hypothetical protein